MHPVERVVWRDSFLLDPGWRSVEEAREARPTKCVSVGFVIGETSRWLHLAQNHCHGGLDVSGVTVIPKSAIVRRTKIGG